MSGKPFDSLPQHLITRREIEKQLRRESRIRQAVKWIVWVILALVVICLLYPH